jgi:hypothetical protein
MEFTLVYQGPLKANGRVKEKQCLRRIFHRQLKQLWETSIFKSVKNCYFLDDNPPKGNTSIIRKVGKFRFAPLVTQRLHLYAELSIMMLRPGPAGAIAYQGGDIDNRLKTLFDSLRMPENESEIPENDSPEEKDEDPFFCLLEDDKFITKISVETDQLLEPTDDPTFVNLMMHVKIKATALTLENTTLA